MTAAIITKAQYSASVKEVSNYLAFWLAVKVTILDVDSRYSGRAAQYVS